MVNCGRTSTCCLFPESMHPISIIIFGSPVGHFLSLQDTHLPTIFNHTVRKKQDKESRNEEPEWFTFGPSSQFETMELKGFDEDELIKRGVDKIFRCNITHLLSLILFAPMSGA